MSSYGWTADYLRERQEVVNNMTVEQVRELAGTYTTPDNMIWLVVGDARTQLVRLKALGYGDPVRLN